VGEHQESRAADGQEAEPQGPLRGQGRGGDEHGRQEQHGKGIFQPAGQVEQPCQLQDVEGQERRGDVVAEPVARRILDAQEQVDPDRGADGQEAQAEGERKAEAEAHPGDRRRLACDGEPAQANEGVEAQMPGVVGQALLVDFGHHRTE
jgi:hypothetical protein